MAGLRARISFFVQIALIFLLHKISFNIGFEILFMIRSQLISHITITTSSLTHQPTLFLIAF
jgi:ribosomal protein L19